MQIQVQFEYDALLGAILLAIQIVRSRMKLLAGKYAQLIFCQFTELKHWILQVQIYQPDGVDYLLSYLVVDTNPQEHTLGHYLRLILIISWTETHLILKHQYELLLQPAINLLLAFADARESHVVAFFKPDW